MNYQAAVHMVLAQSERLTRDQVQDLAEAQGCIVGRTAPDRDRARLLLSRLADAIPEWQQAEYWEAIGGKNGT